MDEYRISSNSVLMSFSEMAWIALLGVALLYSSHMAKAKKTAAKQENEVKKPQSLGKNIQVEASYLRSLQKSLKEQDQKITLLEEKLRNSYKLLEKLEEQDHKITLLELKLQNSYKLRKQNENRITALEQEKKSILEDLNKANKERKLLAAKLNRSTGTDQSIRKELIGLKGNFERVVFIFDCSSSMGESGRWDYSCGIVKSWLQHLSVKQCALITYNQNVTVFPASLSQKFLDMSGENRQENFIRFIDHLNHVEHRSTTDTLKALKKAFEYKPDTIVLFTDGAPSERTKPVGKINLSIRRIRNEILSLCKMHNDIPINIVGLGNYFDERYGPFMLQIAEVTGGAFIGR